MAEPLPPTHHATALVVHGHGLLICGASGTGKSTLALTLLHHASARGWQARLVADDRVILEAHHNRLIVRAVPALAGLIEIAGIGIRSIPHEPAARIDLAITLGEGWDRLPEDVEATVVLAGVAVPHLRLGAQDPSNEAKIASIVANTPR
jgi:serine kinase of HPr protein (carbohydrate metabolism regulator)